MKLTPDLAPISGTKKKGIKKKINQRLTSCHIDVQVVLDYNDFFAGSCLNWGIFSVFLSIGLYSHLFVACIC